MSIIRDTPDATLRVPVSAYDSDIEKILNEPVCEADGTGDDRELILPVCAA